MHLGRFLVDVDNPQTSELHPEFGVLIRSDMVGISLVNYDGDQRDDTGDNFAVHLTSLYDGSVARKTGRERDQSVMCR